MSLTLFAPATVPDLAAVESIAAISDPVLRNLQITQCYCELSVAFARRTGLAANWCTFATWASKQAGQTIRKEDMKRLLLSCLEEDEATTAALTLIGALAKGLGVNASFGQIRQSALGAVINQASDRAASAVSRGNKKVFEEIARQFALFIQTCFAGETHDEARLAAFCSGLKPGPPPEGQDYFRQAFTHYYTRFFEPYEKRKAELVLMANLEIGFHEQTRLQPEIKEALDAGTVDQTMLKQQVQALLFSQAGFWKKIMLLFQRLFGKPLVPDTALTALSQRVQELVRMVLTAHLMTLSFPPDKRLRLGKDLTTSFPSIVARLQNPDLLLLLQKIDPTPDSVRQSGATDWGNLEERMHFIADLFRCFCFDQNLFSGAFNPVQTKAIKEGRVPAGAL